MKSRGVTQCANAACLEVAIKGKVTFVFQDNFKAVQTRGVDRKYQLGDFWQKKGASSVLSFF